MKCAKPFRIKKDVISRTLDQREVILNLKTKRYFGLNEMETRIWAMLKKKKTFDQMQRDILKNYAVPEKRLTRDIEKFLNDLRRNRLIENT